MMVFRKCIFIVLSVFLLSGLLVAKEKTEVKVNGRASVKFSKLNDEFAMFTGFNGTLIFNDSFIVGVGGYGLASKNKYECSQECIDYAANDYDSACNRRSNGNVESSDLSVGYGGLVVGYQFNPASFMDIELKGLVGGGLHSSYKSWLGYQFKVSFFVFEPELMVKFVITKYIAVALGISYRVVAAMDSDTIYSFRDLSAVAGTFDICLGSF